MPTDALRAVIIAAVPIAEKQKVDVVFLSGSGTEVDGTVSYADLSDAVEALFGPPRELVGYVATFGEDVDAEVRAYTRTSTQVLEAMGLE